MIYTADYTELAGMLNHIELAKYLRILRWTELERREYCIVFQTTCRGELYQINVPNDRNLIDYKRVMRDAVVTLAQVYQQSEERTLLELLNPVSDIVRVRLRVPDLETGSIYVEDAVRLYANIRKLVAAAAMDTTYPRERFTRPTQNVQQFIKRCRFGQTEIGSYVVSLICPILLESSKIYKQATLFDSEEDTANSITRKAVSQMIRATEQVKNAVESGNIEDIVYRSEEESTANRVSVNFLDALQGMVGDRDNCDLDISVQWSPVVVEKRAPVSTITLHNDYFAPVRSLIRRFSSRTTSTTTYIGRIQQVRSNPDAQKRDGGTITLVFLDENNKAASATFALTLDDYCRAVTAHQRGDYVRLDTAGGQKPSKSTATECSRFSVLSDR